jgi:mRNA-degrading endonuclease RelE of RelBE toxin-antitoxin system
MRTPSARSAHATAADVHKRLQQLPGRCSPLRCARSSVPDPGPPVTVELVGRADDRRARIGEYRIVFAINDPAATLTIMQVRHRREAYR